MNSLLVRVLSAFAALFVLFGVFFLLGNWGLKLLVGLAVAAACREVDRLLFERITSRSVRACFYIVVACVFCVGVFRFDDLASAFVIAVLVFLSATLSLNSKFDNLGELANFQGQSLLGLFYVGLLPAFANQVIQLPDGKIWFLALLAFVFLGDTGAYFAGTQFGKTPLLPSLSPKKTVEGSIGGILGSLLGAAIFSYFLPIPFWQLATISLAAGVMGQMGDFFESLLKRVARRKDSGTLMPGHGGVLDRIDGVLFAAPVFYLLTRLFLAI